MIHTNDYCVDVVFCVDLTVGAKDLLQQFKDNCLAIVERICKKLLCTKFFAC